MRTAALHMVGAIAWADENGRVYIEPQLNAAQVKRDLDALEARAVKALCAVMVEMRDFLVAKLGRGDASKIVRTLDFSGRVRADLRRAIRQDLACEVRHRLDQIAPPESHATPPTLP